MSLESIIARGKYVRQEQRETLQLPRQTPEDTPEQEELKHQLRLIEDELEDCIYGYNLYMADAGPTGA